MRSTVKLTASSCATRSRRLAPLSATATTDCDMSDDDAGADDADDVISDCVMPLRPIDATLCCICCFSLDSSCSLLRCDTL